MLVNTLSIVACTTIPTSREGGIAQIFLSEKEKRNAQIGSVNGQTLKRRAQGLSVSQILSSVVSTWNILSKESNILVQVGIISEIRYI
jgi:hypothetical protein